MFQSLLQLFKHLQTLNFHSPSTTVVDIPQQQHKTTTKFVRMPRNSRALNKSTPNMAVNNTTPKKDKTPKTSFLDLPAEIRNDIYTLALTNRTLSFPPASPQNRYGRARPPSLLLSNKQIHHETLPMFYSNTTFHFPSPDPLLRWLRKIGAKKRVLVKEIIVDEKAPSSAGPSLGLQAHEMLRVLERRLRDAGVRLPVEVYKVRMRRSRLWAGGEIEEVEEGVLRGVRGSRGCLGSRCRCSEWRLWSWIGEERKGVGVKERWGEGLGVWLDRGEVK